MYRARAGAQFLYALPTLECYFHNNLGIQIRPSEHHSAEYT